MIILEVGKLRSIFDGLATDVEAVVTEHAQYENEISRLRNELLGTLGELGAFKHLKDLKNLMVANARYERDLVEARRTIRELRKDAKAQKKKRR